jgi:hypothetical protein
VYVRGEHIGSFSVYVYPVFSAPFIEVTVTHPYKVSAVIRSQLVNKTWWFTPVVLATKKGRQEDLELEASPGKGSNETLSQRQTNKPNNKKPIKAGGIVQVV